MSPVIVVPGRIGGEFRHIEAAEPHGAGVREPLDHRCGDGGPIVLENFGPAGRDLARAVVHVLMRERHAVQQPDARAAFERLVGFARGFERVLFLERDEAVELRLHRLRLVDAGTRQFDGGDFPATDRGRGLDERELGEFVHLRFPTTGAGAVSSAVKRAGSSLNSRRSRAPSIA